jgi:hypothetical protein
VTFQPLEPFAHDTGQEKPNPDIINIGDKLALVYQERAGGTRFWHLRYAEITGDI